MGCSCGHCAGMGLIGPLFALCVSVFVFVRARAHVFLTSGWSARELNLLSNKRRTALLGQTWK